MMAKSTTKRRIQIPDTPMPDRFQEPATDVCFDGRLALQDLVLPLYRRTIYERLEPRINGGLGVFTGISGETHGVVVSDDLAVAENQRVLNRHYIGGPAEWKWEIDIKDNKK